MYGQVQGCMSLDSHEGGAVWGLKSAKGGWTWNTLMYFSLLVSDVFYIFFFVLFHRIQISIFRFFHYPIQCRLCCCICMCLFFAVLYFFLTRIVFFGLDQTNVSTLTAYIFQCPYLTNFRLSLWVYLYVQEINIIWLHVACMPQHRSWC